MFTVQCHRGEARRQVKLAAHRYEIVVFGAAGPGVQAAFGDFDVELTSDCTALRAAHLDQAALFGALDRIRDLGLELVAVHRIDDVANA